MPFGWVAGANLVGGLVGADAAKKGSEAQADAARYGANIQKQMFDITNEQQRPYREAGYGALGQMQHFMNMDSNDPNSFMHKFDANDLNGNLAPNWEFALKQGQGATQNMANQAGGMISGNAMKGMADYTLGKSGDLYQQAFQNYTGNQTNIFNRLASIAGLGETSNQATGNAASYTGRGISDAYGNMGAAKAAGMVGQANAYSGALNNAGSMYAMSNFMPKNDGPISPDVWTP